MGVNHGDDGKKSELSCDEIVTIASGLLGGERVDDQPAGIPAHERDVGDVVATYLVHALTNLEKAMMMIELRMTPQTGVHCVGSLVAHCEEFVVIHIDDSASGGVHNVASGVRSDETTGCTLEVAPIGRGSNSGITSLRMRCCGLVIFEPRHGASHIDRGNDLSQ